MFIASYCFIIIIIIASFARLFKALRCCIGSLLGKWPRAVHVISNHFIAFVYICFFGLAAWLVGS